MCGLLARTQFDNNFARRLVVKRFLLFLAAACLLVTGTAQAQDEEPMSQIFPYKSHVEVLDNGLKVILVPMSSNGLVSYWSIVRTGSRDEYEPGHTGFAHFFEHMMFRGTEKYPQDVYNEITVEMGADANAFTSDDLTAYHLAITSEDLEKVIDIESDRFQNLSYPEQAFKTEAGAVYGEYRKNRMNPFFAIYEAVHEEAFDVHTYGHTTMGYEKDIKAMPTMFDYSRSFFSRYYRPDNVVVLVTGDIEIEPTLELIRKYYADWEPGYVEPQIKPEPEQKGERRIEVSYEGRSLPIVWIAYKVDAFDSTNKPYVAADLLAELAFGSTSDLYKKLVIEEQVVEFLQAGMGMNRDPNLWNIYTRVKDPEKVDYVIGEIDRVVAESKETLADPQRVADLKSRLKYGFLMGLETPDQVAGALSRVIAVTGGIEAIDDMYVAYEAVTPEDVQAAANKYLDADRRTVAVLKGMN
jgi:zinc protease